MKIAPVTVSTFVANGAGTGTSTPAIRGCFPAVIGRRHEFWRTSDAGSVANNAFCERSAGCRNAIRAARHQSRETISTAENRFSESKSLRQPATGHANFFQTAHETQTLGSLACAGFGFPALSRSRAGLLCARRRRVFLLYSPSAPSNSAAKCIGKYLMTFAPEDFVRWICQSSQPSAHPGRKKRVHENLRNTHGLVRNRARAVWVLQEDAKTDTTA